MALVINFIFRLMAFQLQSNTHVLQPTGIAERIGSLDFLRGIAILTILLINIENFCYPDSWSPFKYGFQTEADRTTRFWVYFLTQGKSYSMLALLFATGFYIFIERFKQKQVGESVMDVYGRRVLWLFVFGVIHAYLIWDGDILHHYAVCGLLIIPFRSISSKTLGFILLVPVVVILINSYVNAEDTKARYITYHNSVSKEEHQRNAADYTIIQQWEAQTATGKPDSTFIEPVRKNYFENIRDNASHLNIHYGKIFNQGILYRSIIMMLLGIMLFRSGVFADYRSVKYYWPLTMLLLAGALTVNFFRYHHWTYDYNKPVTDFMEEWLYAFPKELLGLAYILLFNGIYQLLPRSGVMKLISNIGRMALSNYIFQSIICSFLFYGYGLGLYNRLSRLELLYAVLIIWCFQMFFSWLWLRKFDYGPLEWLWRKLTYKVLE
jgi:uncharacterized protein